MAQVAPPTKLALQSIQVNENLSKYPQVHYGIPQSDNDFAAARDSLRDRERGITSNTTVGENQKITLVIPPQQRNLIPDELMIRLKLRVDNWKSNVQFGGSIQRAIRTFVVRDGRGTVLEQIHDYNLIAQRLIDVHIPERVQHNVLQTEGVYPHYRWLEQRTAPFVVTSAAAIANNVTDLTDETLQANEAKVGKTTPFANLLKPLDTLFPLSAQHAFTGQRVKEIKSGNADPKAVLYGNFGHALAAYDPILVVPRNEFSPYYEHVAKPLAHGGEAIFSFQPIASGLLTSSKHIPLWVTKGLQIELTLDTNTNIFTSLYAASDDTPTIKVTQADAMYTAVTLTPVMQAALESQYHRRGLNLLVPVFHADIRNTGTGSTIQEDYYNSFAMLNRIYQCTRNKAHLDNKTEDNLGLIALKPTRRYLEYNRIYMPHWGNDNDLDPQDHYVESRKGINFLGDKKTELISFGQFGAPTKIDPNRTEANYAAAADVIRNARVSGEKEIFVNNLETEPSGFLTGIDTNNGTIRLRIETNDNTTEKNLVVIFMAFKMITFQDGAPPLVQE